MRTYDKSLILRVSKRDIKRSTKSAGKTSHSVGVKVRNQEKMKLSKDHRPTRLEGEYVRLFAVPDNQQQEFYSDDYNLEQPSALKYVPSTTEPNAEV